jgi:hypothetical protein
LRIRIAATRQALFHSDVTGRLWIVGAEFFVHEGSRANKMAKYEKGGILEPAASEF